MRFVTVCNASYPTMDISLTSRLVRRKQARYAVRRGHYLHHEHERASNGCQRDTGLCSARRYCAEPERTASSASGRRAPAATRGTSCRRRARGRARRIDRRRDELRGGGGGGGGGGARQHRGGREDHRADERDCRGGARAHSIARGIAAIEVGRCGYGYGGVNEGARAPGDSLTVGLGLIGCRDSLTPDGGNSKAASPLLVSRSRRTELIEINRCRGCDRRTREAECTRGGGTINCTNSSQVNHIDVVTSHELDVERLPGSSRVRGPCDRTSGSRLEDLSRAWVGRRDVRQSDQCDGQEKSRESAARKHGGRIFAAWESKRKRGRTQGDKKNWTWG